ncbi:MAG: DUF5063 domain-containing protein [Bacillota bacterium]|nr:DUF5063 domain-containing protein [Bacillota bacterium]
MQSKAADDFFHSAVTFCSIIENFNSNQEENKLKNLLVSLLDLYSKALHLPDVEPENDEFIEVKLSLPQINFRQCDNYWEVFNPYEFEEPLVASLSDDILGIYGDVKKGIVLYEQNQEIEAIWQWKFGLEIHWGSHAVDAVRALHSVIFQDID